MKDKQSVGLKRNTIDKYYTKLEIVNLCLTEIKKYIDISSNDLIIEPSAGNGSFIQGIKELSNYCLFYDIEPENKKIIKQDYLRLDYKELVYLFSKIHIIGNPPFGRQSSFAIKFIKKSCEFCSSLSFILPKSFKKESLKKIFPLNFHLLLEIDIPKDSFLVENLEYDVPCILQIWEKRDYTREIIEKLEPDSFIFVKKTENPHISFRRVGHTAGFIDTNIEDKSIQSHYFIKFTNTTNIDINIKNLQNIQFNHNNTVGPRSISKQELIKEFNMIL